MTIDTQRTLLEFSACIGVAGMEAGAVEYARGLLEPFGPTEVTPLGSLICRVLPRREGRPHILLDAHIDEIGLIVTYIEESGFLRVAGCGGMDPRLLMAYPVAVHTAAGPVEGVVCSIPPHLSAGEEKKNKKPEEVHVDIGLDREGAARAVHPGDRVTLLAPSRPLGKAKVSSKATDDRAGCVSLLKALEYLGEDKPDCGLSVVFSSMEEVGGQGARTAAWREEPTHALVVDVSFAHTHDSKRELCGELGKGPMIGHAPILSRALSLELEETATAEGIPFQLEVMGGRTGTNADAVAVARGGVATALVSIPQKHMHSPVEIVSVEDVENTGRLIAAWIRKMGGRAE